MIFHFFKKVCLNNNVHLLFTILQSCDNYKESFKQYRKKHFKKGLKVQPSYLIGICTLLQLSNPLPTLHSLVLFIKDARSLGLMSSRTCTWDCLRFKMAAKKKTKGGIDHEQIIMQFNQMRQEIRSVMGKIGELELEVNEHR